MDITSQWPDCYLVCRRAAYCYLVCPVYQRADCCYLVCSMYR